MTDHTYLRYECADSFGLTIGGSSSKAPPSNAILAWAPTNDPRRAPLLATAGSYVIGYNVRTSSPVLRVGHREQLSGGVGTGRALNADEVVCLAVRPEESSSSVAVKLATGWMDGVVRVFEIEPEELQRPHGLVHSLIHDNNDEDFVRREPLVLNGHASAVRTLAFETDRLASGGSDGAVVVWDIVAETGLFRLIGHRGGITEIRFLSLDSFHGLVTASLDGLVKIWDLDGQCCVQTLANHRGEVWATDLLHWHPSEDHPERWRLVTGGSDGQVRVWNLHAPRRSTVGDQDEPGRQDDVCDFMGLLSPPPNVSTSAEKIMCVKFHPTGRYVGVLRSSSKTIDVYAVRGEQETQRKRHRRLRRRQEKSKKREKSGGEVGQKRGILDDPESSQDENDEEPTEEQLLDPDTVKASDEFEYVTTVRATHKVRGFVFQPYREKGELARVVCALATNGFETHAFIRKSDDEKKTNFVVSERITTMDISGHPTGIRAVALSSDDALACTVSKNVTKIWNVESRSCIQSLAPAIESQKKASAYGLCATFLPGNTHVVVGTREGHLIIIDVAAGEVVYTEERAHDSAIWSIDLRRQASDDAPVTLVTGSADKKVKFWDVETEENEDSTAEHPVVIHTRTLEMSDDVVAVRYSHTLEPTKRLIFVSMLDSTIKVFFDDSLKLFLSLYGHKLPALAVDSSDDDVILASSGADKAIKIWGLDFGDTHRTLHGHEDSITDLRFVRRTHNFFTTSKDGTVRYWDGDRFEQILYLPGHSAEVNCLAISRTGAFVLSGGMDRQVRVWERTKDIVFLEEERERQLEQTFDKVSNRDEGGTAGILERKGNESDEDEDQDMTDQPQSEAAVKRSVLSVASGDRIMEGLERADQEIKEIMLFRKTNGPEKKRQPNPMLMGMEPAHYVLWVLKTIKSADLEQSLLVLPLTHLERLIYYCTVLLKQGRGLELCSRVAIFVVKVHQHQLAANKTMAIPLRELRRLIRLRLSEARDMVGYNLAALRLTATIAHERKQSYLSHDDSQTKDIWAGLGLGSDVAAALEGKPIKR